MSITTTTPFYFNSNDASAPQITANSAASVLAVLKACLVGTSGTAYGVKPSAGWSIAFEDDTNVAIAFQMATGNKRYLRLGNPTNTGTTGYEDYSYFEVRGYNAMTDVNTGTNAFPTTAQHSTWRLAYAAQSAINTTTNIPWSLIASGNFFYLQLQVGNNGNNQGSGWGSCGGFYFGDVVSYVPGDTMQTIITGWWLGANYNQTGNPCWSNNTSSYSYLPFKGSDSFSNYDGYCYIYGSAQQAYGPYVAQMHFDEMQGNGWAGYTGQPNPAPTGQFFFSKALVFENSGTATIRGEMPGLMIPLHPRPFPDQYQIQIGTDTYVTWLNDPPLGNNAPSYEILLDMSTWNTN